MKVLYLSSVVPRRSETFVYREVLGLRALGLEVGVASLHSPERGLGEGNLEAMASEVITVYPPGFRRLLMDAAMAFFSHFPRSMAAIGLAFRDALQVGDVRGPARVKILIQAVAGLALARRVQSTGYEHLHVHMAHAPATVGMYAATALGIPFSFTGHAVDLFREASLLKQKLGRARFVACISHWHRDWYRSIVQRPDGDYLIIRCGVDVPPMAREPDRDDGLKVLGLARLVPKKGFDTLIEAVRLLALNGQTVECTIAGEGSEEQRLKQQAADANLSGKVKFLGAVHHSEVPRLLRDANVFVLPCRVLSDGDRDGIPVSVMEAMAAGVCVVTGDLPAVRELVEHEKSGLLIPPGDAKALAEALVRLVMEPGLRQGLAIGGHARVIEEFSSNENLQRLVSAFCYIRKP